MSCTTVAAGLESWFGNATLSDITLVVDDRRIPAHKLVLANASPVFAQMFKADMQELVTGQVRMLGTHQQPIPRLATQIPAERQGCCGLSKTAYM